MTAVGSVITLRGVLGMLVVDICAIVDACRVAKVRNMYDGLHQNGRLRTAYGRSDPCNEVLMAKISRYSTKATFPMSRGFSSGLSSA